MEPAKYVALQLNGTAAAFDVVLHTCCAVFTHTLRLGVCALAVRAIARVT